MEQCRVCGSRDFDAATLEAIRDGDAGDLRERWRVAVCNVCGTMVRMSWRPVSQSPTTPENPNN